MRAKAKICGLSDERSVAAAVSGGAAMLGFVFYPPSPRHLTPARAAKLIQGLTLPRVGVFVNPSDAELDHVLAEVPLSHLQFHGDESPARLAAVKARHRLGVIKAIKVGSQSDIAAFHDYLDVADLLLFDAKLSKSSAGELPGGNGLPFDWRLLQGFAPPLPWLLAGGLSPGNVRTALKLTGAAMVDVSSGVESAPGVKDVAKIAAFLAALDEDVG